MTASVFQPELRAELEPGRGDTESAQCGVGGLTVPTVPGRLDGLVPSTTQLADLPTSLRSRAISS